MTRPEVRTLRDAAPLAALAHPFRSRIMDALKVDGPSTASMLAARTGQAVGNASHHLKVLAAAGLVEEAPELARDRRERWWRLVSAGTRWSRRDLVDQAAVTAAQEAEALGAAPSAGAVARLDGQRRHRPRVGGRRLRHPELAEAQPRRARSSSPTRWSRCSPAGATARSPTTACTASRSSPSPAPSRASRERRHDRPGPVAPPIAGNGNFRLLWFGEGVSVLGSMTTAVVVPLVAVTAFGAGAAWMGLLTAAAWLPWLVVGLPAGAWIDRADARRVMIAADLGAACRHRVGPGRLGVGRAHPPPPRRRRARCRHRLGLPARRLPPAPPPRRRARRPRHRQRPAGGHRVGDAGGRPRPRRRPRRRRLRRVRRRRRRGLLPRLRALPAPDGPQPPACPPPLPSGASRCARRSRPASAWWPATPTCGSSPSRAVRRTSRSPGMPPCSCSSSCATSTSTRAGSAS